MQGNRVTDISTINKANEIIEGMLGVITYGVKELSELGIHKQNANRYLEPFQHIKVLITVTDIQGFFDLRYDEAAMPEIYELAKSMIAEYYMSAPKFVDYGEWHLPFAEGIGDLNTARKVSSSCAAQTSYRKQDESIEKAEDIFNKLVNSNKLHASPFEHQCTPMQSFDTQVGNLTGWKQYRHYIEEDLGKRN